MLFDILFFLLLFIIFFGVFLYPRIIFLFKKNPWKRVGGAPPITVLIPAYDEEKMIAAKIKNTLAADYTKGRMEVVVINNGSHDRTAEIAKEFPVTLLESANGKINALNKGLEYAKTDVIIMTDVDIIVARDSFKNLVLNLSDEIGAVNCYISSWAQGAGALLKEKKKYREDDWKLRESEGLVDSVCNLDGKIIAFRKSIFPQFSARSLTDDYSMTFAIRGKGYRLVVDKSARAYENVSGNGKSELMQFKRYAVDVIITNFKNIKFLFNPKYGYFGLMTFPFRRFFPPLYPLMIVYIFFYLFSIYPFYTAVIFFIGIIAALLFRRLMLIQLLAVALAYPALFRQNKLRGGRWQPPRK